MTFQSSIAAKLGLAICCALAVSWPHCAAAQDTYRLKIFERTGDAGFYPTAINGLGHLAGVSDRADGRHTMKVKGDVVEDLGVYELGWYPYAMNVRGQMVGFYSSFDYHNVASSWGRLGPVVLGRVGSTSYAEGINERGEIAGSTIFVRDDWSLTERMTMWYCGRATYYSREGGYVVYGSGINNVGQVSGVHKVGSSDPSRAVFWEQGTMTYLGGDGSSAYALNDRGQIVGAESSRARLWQAGAFVDLGAQIPGTSAAYDINKIGDAVGWGFFPRLGAVLWSQETDGHRLIDLNTLLRPGAPEAGWWLTQANRINDRGEIIGYATNLVTCPQMNCLWGFVLTHSPLPDEYPAEAAPAPSAVEHDLKLLRNPAIAQNPRDQRAPTSP